LRASFQKGHGGGRFASPIYHANAVAFQMNNLPGAVTPYSKPVNTVIVTYVDDTHPSKQNPLISTH